MQHFLFYPRGLKSRMVEQPSLFKERPYKKSAYWPQILHIYKYIFHKYTCICGIIYIICNIYTHIYTYTHYLYVIKTQHNIYTEFSAIKWFYSLWTELLKYDSYFGSINDFAKVALSAMWLLKLLGRLLSSFLNCKVLLHSYFYYHTSRSGWFSFLYYCPYFSKWYYRL